MGVPPFLVRAAAAALIASPAAAQAQRGTLEMTPSSEWTVDYADESCALRRSFQSGDHQVELELRQFAPGDSFQVILLSPNLQQSRSRPRLRFEPDEGFYSVEALAITRDSVPGVLYKDSFRPNSVKRRSVLQEWPENERDARERAVSGLTAASAFRRTVTLQLGSMHPPMNAMRACLDELVANWGLDPATQRTLSHRAVPLDLADWARRIQAVYPPAMLRQGRMGFVNIRMLVGPDGKPTACIPIKDFSTPGFEETACALSMRYALFEPARDAEGTPVSSFYSTTISYHLY